MGYFKIKEVESMPSTNAYLLENSETLPSGTAVSALVQTAGKGRRQKQWKGQPGAGLYLSFLYKAKAADFSSLAPLYLALCVGNVLRTHGVAAKVKWPNDILVAGKKVCGILCEAKFVGEQVHFVGGVGLNLCQGAQFFAGLPHASSVLLASGVRLARGEMAHAILKEVEEKAHLLQRPESFLNAFRPHCITLQNWVRLHYENQVVEGFATDIAKGGQLMVQVEGELRLVNSGQVSVRGKDGYV